MNSCAVYLGVHAELSVFCCSLYELGYVTSNATRGCTEGYSKVITQEEAPSSPHCLDGASGSLMLPDESENTSDDNPGKLQVHITVMCTEIQALQQTSWGHCIWEWWEDLKQFLGSKVSVYISKRCCSSSILSVTKSLRSAKFLKITGLS